MEDKNMQYTDSDIQKLADRFEVPREDIIYILLNVSGVKYEKQMPRIRTTLKLEGKDDRFYFGLANNP